LLKELRKHVIAPLSRVSSAMQERPTDLSQIAFVDRTSFLRDGAPQEVLSLVDSYNGLVKMIHELNVRDRERIELLSYNQLAAQVSHDIRSPLSALRMASAGLSEIPEERKLLMQTAIERINEISQSLLKRKLAGVSAPEPMETPRKFIIVADVVNSLVREKSV